ncbi:hypothetical protein [Sphingomonas montanisoli]|uniref:Sulfotransferase n=1 Tax=Sphingomonas montanisoli TaxID=2606412 RepID=A0A5D9C3F7_9SPHN|nr:hypothetical protein [Sphingomonas montanisoli]TZG26274.1 hypothetical protein FYJ91_15135 [Sphingomonas montanisoli]
MISISSLGFPLTPEWLAHRYDPDHDAFQFVVSDRAQRQSIPFLTDENMPQAREPLVASRNDIAVSAPAAPLHFIFHSAYCCSTLLVNALDQRGSASGLKEPVLLNDIVGWRHRGGQPERIGDVLDRSLTLLARPFEEGEAVIVKPSNIVNGLSAAMLSMRPDAKAILLHAPLGAFVGSIARKGMWGRLWVRELLANQLAEGMVRLGFEQRDYLLHTDLQAAAVGWLAQQALFAEIARRWPDRVRTLNSDVLTARPLETLAACRSFLDLGGTVDHQAVVADIFGRNAKDGTAFASGQREADRVDAQALHGDEIGKVTEWALAIADKAGIPMDLDGALLR